MFRVIIKAWVTTEKRLMIDVRSASKAYQLGDIRDVGWVRSEHNLADGLTKFDKSQLVVDLLEIGHINTVVQQWVMTSDVMCDE